MLFEDLVETSQAVTSASGRLDKIEILAACLARLGAAEIGLGVCYLAGIVPQGRLGVGYAALRAATAPPADRATLLVAEVDAAFAAIAAVGGTGAAATRREMLQGLLGRATDAEQNFLRRLIGGELRQGASEGVVLEAVARASGVPAAAVRRALMLSGDLGEVAMRARAGGTGALAGLTLRVFRPLRPMLAQTAEDVAAALTKTGPAACEYKIDGARIQAHRSGGEVRVFSRTLKEMTDRLPEVVAAVAALPVDTIVLDGEAVGLDSDARPLPFQETMSRFGRQDDAAANAAVTPLTPFFFDVLHLDGTDLIDRPAAERYERLGTALPASLVIPRIHDPTPDAAGAFLAAALEAGHEGVMVKQLSSHYEAGRRGSAWLKVKLAHTLDLVVLAVEWGSGRRRGWLSNLHLGARDPATGGFVMLGKTFKGMTDEMLAWQTERLLELAESDSGRVVRVRPELVVEVAFDGVQASRRYPGGVALRFARVKGYRPDKEAADADTIETVRSIHRRA